MRDVALADPMIAVYLLLAICIAVPLVGYPLLMLVIDYTRQYRLAFTRWRVRRQMKEDASESVVFDAGRPRLELHAPLARFFEPASETAGATQIIQRRRNDQARARVVNFPQLPERSGYDGTNLTLVVNRGERIH